MKSQLHSNSLAAYADGEQGGFNKREQLIIYALRQLGTATDREICQALGFTDPNCTRPRLTRLFQIGYLEEIGTKLDPLTKKRVRIVAIKAQPSEQDQIELVLEGAGA